MYSQRETITICMAITRHLVLRQSRSLRYVHGGQVCVETEAASTRFFLMTKLLFGSWHLLSSNILNNETKHEIISASLRIKRKIPYRILVHEWHIIFFTWVHQKKINLFYEEHQDPSVIVCTFSSCRTIALRGIWVDKPPMVHQSRISRRAMY